ncbi:MAG: hypothetical protein A3J24_10195 [Deltaproteobacteria bacterium RIFCSPLOWO2_02_FULL_53_8]|nr:MAG: hypothetical protein A3J24_10195 [Deltaproteobacteria bacterium RIFCSPLOWO2_02_FULL_53_8]
MIRINLLPVRAAKKKESQRFQLTVAGLAIVLIIIISFGIYLYASGEARALSDQVAADKKELEQLALKIGVLSKIEDEKAVVQGKLDTIKTLEENKTSSIKLLKLISLSMPEKAWLASIKDAGESISIKGYAADEKNVADFMRKLLEHSAELGKIELIQAQRAVEKETNAELMNFEITIFRPVKEDKEKKDKKGKKKTPPPNDAAPKH